MYHYVYILKTLDEFKPRTYVGYSTDIYSRLEKHNNSKGAKSTKGYKWKIIFKKRFLSKSKAMIFEYYLKKNKILRKEILDKYETNF